MKRKADLVFALLILLLAGWAVRRLFFAGTAGATATVRRENEVLLTIDLEKQAGETLSLEKWGIPITFEVEEGRVRFASSDCPDKICIHTGWISESGQTAVCLPNRVTLTID